MLGFFLFLRINDNIFLHFTPISSVFLLEAFDKLDLHISFEINKFTAVSAIADNYVLMLFGIVVGILKEVYVYAIDLELQASELEICLDKSAYFRATFGIGEHFLIEIKVDRLTAREKTLIESGG